MHQLPSASDAGSNTLLQQNPPVLQFQGEALANAGWLYDGWQKVAVLVNNWERESSINQPTHVHPEDDIIIIIIILPSVSRMPRDLGKN